VPVPQLLNNFLVHENRRFITVLTRSLHWFLSWVRSIQPISSHPISLRSIVILSTHLRFGLLSGLCPFRFPTKILYSPPSCYMPWPCSLTWSFYVIKLGEEYKLWSSSLWSFLQPPVTSSLFGRNILLSNLFRDLLGLYVAGWTRARNGTAVRLTRYEGLFVVFAYVWCVFLDGFMLLREITFENFLRSKLKRST
jgi:hypothetical protein